MTLYWHALRQQVVSLLLWACVLAFMVLSVVSAVGAVGQNEAISALIQQMPQAMRALLGGDLILQRPVDGYMHAKIFEYLPLMVAIFAAFQAAAMIAREAELRRFDFLLGLPVTRQHLLLARFGALLTGEVALWVIPVGVMTVLLKQQGLQGDWTGYWLTAWNGFLVDALFTAVALWVSAGAGEYRKALRTGLIAVTVTYVADLSLRMGQAAPLWRRLLPYGYYEPVDLMLSHGFPWLATLVLGAATAAAVLLALRTFVRREV